MGCVAIASPTKSQLGLSVGCHGDVAFSCPSAQQKPPSTSRYSGCVSGCVYKHLRLVYNCHLLTLRNPLSFKRESADHSSSLIEYDQPQKVWSTLHPPLHTCVMLNSIIRRSETHLWSVPEGSYL